MPWTFLCNFDELKEGVGKYVAAAGRTLGVYLDAGQVYVLDDRCPHAGASISAGHVQNGCAICPRHDWAFKLADGYLSDSQYVRVKSYPARVVTSSHGRQQVEAELPSI